MTYVGKPVDRVDGTLKATGAARYAAEFPYPDLAYAALVHATVARGRITRIDAGLARKTPGVVAVITHLNAPAMKPPPKPTPMDLSTMATSSSVSLLNTDEVHWNGQPVAVVVAETLDAAREAAHLVEVEYTELPATVDFAAEEANARPQKNTLLSSANTQKGDAEAALAAAPFSVDLRYTTPGVNHNAIEPHSTTAYWDGDQLVLHDATQNTTWARDQLAIRFDVPKKNVRVISPFVGGAFGGKSLVWPGTVLTALAAKVTGRPVRLMLTRESVYRTVGGRTPSIQRVAIGAEAGGSMTALIHSSVSRVGKVGGWTEQITTVSRHMYDAAALQVRQSLVRLDALPNTIMRAPGESIGSFALESSVDELAYQLGLDPIELRARNEPARNPVDGKAFSHRLLLDCFEQGAKEFGWAERAPQPRATRDGRWLVGMGVAAAYHPAWQFQANLTLRLSADGTVLVRCGFHEMGMGTATAISQITADTLGVPLDAVTIEYGDSDLPGAGTAGASAQTATVTASLLDACEKLTDGVFALARKTPGSPLRGHRRQDVTARDGGLYRDSRGESYGEILRRAGRESIDAQVGSETRLGELTGQVRFMSKFLMDRRRWMKAACGAQFCEVRVDAETGEVRVSRWLGVFDVGRVINTKTAASQLRGGIIMGIGMALAEETLVDPRTGRIVNASLSEYHVPVHADIPTIEVRCLDDPDPTMPLGVVGLGEVSVTGVAAAVANAVHHATGRRIRDLPITLDKLL
ncbi:carbon-monoxide dehydrogenase large subunit [Acrocarpospora phusangensis]|uniref:Carbon-monoxide dehydrogenase large subunit n=1 Tax=Acrocarpospora phusangensis TaxID=1070424 RepID=A0A919QIA3_9ACTN|nr:xanthine dehydrogenase family protein molybdopterin-binding subunit [Acrocarpospora phusangensis]GIH26905.1 carbon-monoxide dehydrogenase large subunit [Acrocarpospora phusangensis]